MRVLIILYCKHFCRMWLNVLDDVRQISRFSTKSTGSFAPSRSLSLGCKKLSMDLTDVLDDLLFWGPQFGGVTHHADILEQTGGWNDGGGNDRFLQNLMFLSDMISDIIVVQILHSTVLHLTSRTLERLSWVGWRYVLQHLLGRHQSWTGTRLTSDEGCRSRVWRSDSSSILRSWSGAGPGNSVPGHDSRL